MKRIITILNSLFLATMLTFVISCGSDNSLTGKSSSGGTSSLVGECSFDSSYAPVCDNKNITYDNISIATCKQATGLRSGNCICQHSLTVCGADGEDYSECDAKNRGIRIVKFTPCGSASL